MEKNINKGAVRHFGNHRVGRELAMTYLFGCEAQQTFPGPESFDRFLESVSDDSGIFSKRNVKVPAGAAKYAVMLYETVAEHQNELDELIKKHSLNWDFDRISPVEKNILRVAAAEICYVPDVPCAVSIDEAAGIARDYASREAVNFINGVLNGIKEEQPE